MNTHTNVNVNVNANEKERSSISALRNLITDRSYTMTDTNNNVMNKNRVRNNTKTQLTKNYSFLKANNSNNNNYNNKNTTKTLQNTQSQNKPYFYCKSSINKNKNTSNNKSSHNLHTNRLKNAQIQKQFYDLTKTQSTQLSHEACMNHPQKHGLFQQKSTMNVYCHKCSINFIKQNVRLISINPKMHFFKDLIKKQVSELHRIIAQTVHQIQIYGEQVERSLIDKYNQAKMELINLSLAQSLSEKQQKNKKQSKDKNFVEFKVQLLNFSQSWLNSIKQQYIKNPQKKCVVLKFTKQKQQAHDQLYEKQKHLNQPNHFQQQKSSVLYPIKSITLQKKSKPKPKQKQTLLAEIQNALNQLRTKDHQKMNNSYYHSSSANKKNLYHFNIDLSPINKREASSSMLNFQSNLKENQSNKENYNPNSLCKSSVLKQSNQVQLEKNFSSLSIFSNLSNKKCSAQFVSKDYQYRAQEVSCQFRGQACYLEKEQQRISFGKWNRKPC